MDIQYESGFKFVIVGSKRILLVESDKIEATTDFIRKNKISSIELNYFHGYKFKDVAFLKAIGDLIEYITIVDDDISLDELSNAKNLKKLFVGGSNKSAIDFEQFKFLEHCNICWHIGLIKLSSCKKLSEMVLRKYVYNVKTSDFLLGLTHLKKLTLIQNKFQDLYLLQPLLNLEELEISYNKDLKDISMVSDCAKKIVKLRIENCKKISDYAPIAGLTHLRYLAISSSADIASLTFIKKLKKLEYFSFVGTNVLDGDLNPCVGLDYVAFDNRKHFSHKFEAMQKQNL